VIAEAGRSDVQSAGERVWSVVWPGLAVVLAIWLAFVSPVGGVLLSLLICSVALRRRRSAGARLPWRRLLVAGVVTLALSAALVPGQHGLVDFDSGGTTSETVPVDS
jgi:hypothetical protein